MKIKENTFDDKGKNVNRFSKTKTVAVAIIPLVVLAGMITFLFGPGQTLLNKGIPLPDVTIERIEFHEGEIMSLIRNTGPEAIEISQADVNDRITPAAIEP